MAASMQRMYYCWKRGVWARARVIGYQREPRISFCHVCESAETARQGTRTGLDWTGIMNKKVFRLLPVQAAVASFRAYGISSENLVRNPSLLALLRLFRPIDLHLLAFSYCSLFTLALFDTRHNATRRPRCLSPSLFRFLCLLYSPRDSRHSLKLCAPLHPDVRSYCLFAHQLH